MPTLKANVTKEQMMQLKLIAKATGRSLGYTLQSLLDSNLEETYTDINRYYDDPDDYGKTITIPSEEFYGEDYAKILSAQAETAKNYMDPNEGFYVKDDVPMDEDESLDPNHWSYGIKKESTEDRNARWVREDEEAEVIRQEELKVREEENKAYREAEALALKHAKEAEETAQMLKDELEARSDAEAAKIALEKAIAIDDLEDVPVVREYEDAGGAPHWTKPYPVEDRRVPVEPEVDTYVREITPNTEPRVIKYPELNLYPEAIAAEEIRVEILEDDAKNMSEIAWMQKYNPNDSVLVEPINYESLHHFYIMYSGVHQGARKRLEQAKVYKAQCDQYWTEAEEIYGDDHRAKANHWFRLQNTLLSDNETAPFIYWIKTNLNSTKLLWRQGGGSGIINGVD